MEVIVECVVTSEAERGDRGALIVIVGGFQRLHRPGVRVGEGAGKCLWSADSEIAATQIGRYRNRILRNSVGVKYTVAAQFSRVDEGPARQRAVGVSPQAAVGVGNIDVGLNEVLTRRCAHAAHAPAERTAIVEIKLQIDVLR